MGTITPAQWKKRVVASAAKTRIPVLGQFELTSRCNLDCKMCYIHNKESNKLLHQELSTEQWKTIFDEAYKMGLMFATLTGGECLLRDDFKELYLYLFRKGVVMTVFTNAVLIDAEWVDFFRTYKPEGIQVSLYGSSEEGYHRVTGHDGYAKAIGGIEALQSAGIEVRVAVTPSSYMGEDYIKIIQLCKQKGFLLGNTSFELAPVRDDPQKTDHLLSTSEILELEKRRALLDGELTPLVEAPTCGGPGVKSPRVGLKCSAGNCAVSVTWDGKMYPCTCIMEGGFSLLEMDYATAWEKTKTVAETIVYGIECDGCVYDKVCPHCPAFRLDGLHSGHCNPTVCELTRQLVAAGVKRIKQIEENCDN